MGASQGTRWPFSIQILALPSMGNSGIKAYTLGKEAKSALLPVSVSGSVCVSADGDCWGGFVTVYVRQRSLFAVHNLTIDKQSLHKQ